nr:phospholipid scramblase 2 [Hymenolepis microstoma]
MFNPVGDKVVTIRRDFKCGAFLASYHLCCCCFWHCGRADCGKGCQNFVSKFMQEIFLEMPDGEILGKVRQEPTSAVPKWTILDPNDNILLRIVGPPNCYLVCLPCLSFTDRLQFKIQSADSHAELGIIRKEWAGFMREMFTDADDFSVTFPPDLDSKVKALVIGAVFLLDFTYFENNHKQSS